MTSSTKDAPSYPGPWTRQIRVDMIIVKMQVFNSTTNVGSDLDSKKNI